MGGTAIGDVHGNVYVGQPTEDPAEALRIYCDMFVKSHRHLPMRGVDVGASDPQRGQQQLDLDRVYVALKTTSTEVREMEQKGTVSPTRIPIPSHLSCANGSQGAITAVEAVASECAACAPGRSRVGQVFLRHLLGLCLAHHFLEPDAGWRKRWRLPQEPGNGSHPRRRAGLLPLD